MVGSLVRSGFGLRSWVSDWWVQVRTGAWAVRKRAIVPLQPCDPTSGRSRFKQKQIESGTKGLDAHSNHICKTFPRRCSWGDSEIWPRVRPVCLGFIFVSPLHLSKWEVFCLATAAYSKGWGVLVIVSYFRWAQSLTLRVSEAPDERTESCGLERSMSGLWLILPQWVLRGTNLSLVYARVNSEYEHQAADQRTPLSQEYCSFLFICDICISASPPLK